MTRPDPYRANAPPEEERRGWPRLRRFWRDVGWWDACWLATAWGLNVGIALVVIVHKAQKAARS